MGAIAVAVVILLWSFGLVVFGLSGLLRSEPLPVAGLRPAIARRGQMFRRPHFHRRAPAMLPSAGPSSARAA